MITGHLGVAAAVRGRWPRAALPWLLPASIAPDLWDVTLALAGVCNPDGLYSHAFPAVLLLAAGAGAVAFLATSSRTTGLACAALVLAHLPLDMISGSKPYWPGGPIIGLDLYRRPMLELLAEVAVTAAGWWALRRTEPAPRWLSSWKAFVPLLLVQASVDLVFLLGITKPSACH